MKFTKNTITHSARKIWVELLCQPCAGTGRQSLYTNVMDLWVYARCLNFGANRLNCELGCFCSLRLTFERKRHILHCARECNCMHDAL